MKGKDGAIDVTGMVNREVTKMDEELEVDLGGGLDRRLGKVLIAFYMLDCEVIPGKPIFETEQLFVW